MSGKDGAAAGAPIDPDVNPMAIQGAETAVAQLEKRLGYGRFAPAGEPVRFSLDGREIEARTDETILQAAERHGVSIPHLCYTEGMRPDGNCRACMVEVEGERVLAASCSRRPTAGMKVSTDSERAVHSQRMVLELLISDAPQPPALETELGYWADRLGVRAGRFPMRSQPAPDLSHPGIQVHLESCIQCTRCVRACREVQVNDVIGYANRGNAATIVFDFDDPMGESTCVGCGECVQACPTGALLPSLSLLAG